MYDKNKVQAQLDKIQAGCKVRLLTTEKIERLITTCEKWIVDRTFPEEMTPYISYEYVESVAKAYNYSAESTRLHLTFTKKGTVKDVSVSRTYAPKGCHTSRFKLNATKLLSEEYDLNWLTTNMKQKQMFNRLIRSFGFNPSSLTAQV